MAQTLHHRRADVLREVIRAADERLDARLPMDVDGVRETFGDEVTLLGALQLRWHTRLSGRIERELALQPMDLDAAVERAWLATARQMPGVRAVLDHHLLDPGDDETARVMAKATSKEHEMLAVMAGRSSLGDPRAADVGRRLADRARASYAARRTVRRHAGPTLVQRLRAVLAA